MHEWQEILKYHPTKRFRMQFSCIYLTTIFKKSEKGYGHLLGALQLKADWIGGFHAPLLPQI